MVGLYEHWWLQDSLDMGICYGGVVWTLVIAGFTGPGYLLWWRCMNTGDWRIHWTRGFVMVGLYEHWWSQDSLDQGICYGGVVWTLVIAGFTGQGICYGGVVWTLVIAGFTGPGDLLWWGCMNTGDCRIHRAGDLLWWGCMNTGDCRIHWTRGFVMVGLYEHWWLRDSLDQGICYGGVVWTLVIAGFTGHGDLLWWGCMNTGDCRIHRAGDLLWWGCMNTGDCRIHRAGDLLWWGCMNTGDCRIHWTRAFVMVGLYEHWWLQDSQGRGFVMVGLYEDWWLQDSLDQGICYGGVVWTLVITGFTGPGDLLWWGCMNTGDCRIHWIRVFFYGGVVWTLVIAGFTGPGDLLWWGYVNTGDCRIHLARRFVMVGLYEHWWLQDSLDQGICYGGVVWTLVIAGFTGQGICYGGVVWTLVIAGFTGQGICYGGVVWTLVIAGFIGPGDLLWWGCMNTGDCSIHWTRGFVMVGLYEHWWLQDSLDQGICYGGVVWTLVIAGFTGQGICYDGVVWTLVIAGFTGQGICYGGVVWTLVIAGFTGQGICYGGVVWTLVIAGFTDQEICFGGVVWTLVIAGFTGPGDLLWWGCRNTGDCRIHRAGDLLWWGCMNTGDCRIHWIRGFVMVGLYEHWWLQDSLDQGICYGGVVWTLVIAGFTGQGICYGRVVWTLVIAEFIGPGDLLWWGCMNTGDCRIHWTRGFVMVGLYEHWWLQDSQGRGFVMVGLYEHWWLQDSLDQGICYDGVVWTLVIAGFTGPWDSCTNRDQLHPQGA